MVEIDVRKPGQKSQRNDVGIDRHCIQGIVAACMWSIALHSSRHRTSRKTFGTDGFVRLEFSYNLV